LKPTTKYRIRTPEKYFDDMMTFERNKQLKLDIMRSVDRL